MPSKITYISNIDKGKNENKTICWNVICRIILDQIFRGVRVKDS